MKEVWSSVHNTEPEKFQLPAQDHANGDQHPPPDCRKTVCNTADCGHFTTLPS